MLLTFRGFMKVLLTIIAFVVTMGFVLPFFGLLNHGSTIDFVVGVAAIVLFGWLCLKFITAIWELGK